MGEKSLREQHELHKMEESGAENRKIQQEGQNREGAEEPNKGGVK